MRRRSGEQLLRGGVEDFFDSGMALTSLFSNLSHLCPSHPSFLCLIFFIWFNFLILYRHTFPEMVGTEWGV